MIFGAQVVLAGGIYQNLDAAAGSDLAKNSNLMLFIGNLVRSILALLGLLLLLTIIYAGIIWGFMSNGDNAKIKKAKEMIINAVIGLVIVFASYSLTTFITDRLAEASRS